MKKTWIIFLVFGLIFLGLGIYGFIATDKDEVVVNENDLIIEYANSIKNKRNEALLNNTTINDNWFKTTKFVSNGVNCRNITFRDDLGVIMSNCTVNKKGNYFYANGVYTNEQQFNSVISVPVITTLSCKTNDDAEQISYTYSFSNGVPTEKRVTDTVVFESVEVAETEFNSLDSVIVDRLRTTYGTVNLVDNTIIGQTTTSLNTGEIQEYEKDIDTLRNKLINDGLVCE